jgi:hypothetical protein
MRDSGEDTTRFFREANLDFSASVCQTAYSNQTWERIERSSSNEADLSKRFKDYYLAKVAEKS